MQKDLNILLIQSNINSLSPENNYAFYRQMLAEINTSPDLILFPELFNTGFSSRLQTMAKSETHRAVDFLQEISQKCNSQVIASVVVEDSGSLYNRLFWISPQGIRSHYDKKHLFFGDEKALCQAGKERIVVEYAGWHFMPLICYDIRFPLWCRNRVENQEWLYDCLIFIANFPANRAHILRSLAVARAIENQAYVLVVNRIGKDGNEICHSGNSMVINPIGEIIAEAPENKPFLLSATIRKKYLDKSREMLPVYKDWEV